MKTILLPDGTPVPALGMGTWMMGDSSQGREQEIATLRRGLDLGLRLIDTAEMYGEGASEALVGEAIRGRRDEVFLVSKVYPHNASASAMPKSCEASLRRLGVECLDLYLLHWSGRVPIEETVQAFEKLRAQGKIRRWGVSNLDMREMRALSATPGGGAVATNQVLYNLGRRGIEWDLLPWCRQRGVPVMAYSPIEQGQILDNPGLCALAESLGLTPARLALAWLLHQDGIIAIPKTSTRAHLEDNALAADTVLSAETLAALDVLFPPPDRATPLDML
jgi:aldehyde reductase